MLKIRKNAKVLFILLLFALSTSLHAEVQRGKWGFVPIAAPFYTPDTSWGGGAFLLAYRDVTIGEDRETDQLGFASLLTLKGQKTIALSPDMVLSENFRILGNFSYSNSNEDFWGIGQEAKESDLEIFTAEEFLAKVSLLRKLNQDLFIGPQVLFRSIDIIETEDNGIIDRGGFKGTEGGIETGFGIRLIYDTTDSTFYPTKGFLVEGSSLISSTSAGSDYDYTSFKADVRYYQGITGKHVLAFQSVIELNTDGVPFQSMSKLGGATIMRGLPEGRFTDENSLSFQGEYRFPIISFLAGAVFASTGIVEKDIAELTTFADYHFAGGGGLRFLVNREKHIAIRLDFGLSEDGLKTYFIFREAF
ncbi:MAG: BamA/TamA family outer membrane protein [Spirochaetia bacterium]|jgi:outer membrane protein assembly factor BamA|nr:BamA/TamA family outer membrane protein [Spirochaetia bacterium]